MRIGLFFLESGDRGRGGLAVAHKINHPGFYYFSFYGGVGRAMGCMDGNGAELEFFFDCDVVL